MSKQYTADGKRRSSMVHATRGWTCDCGRRVMGNGGKASHQRACTIWAEHELRRMERLIASVTADRTYVTETETRWLAERDQLRERLHYPPWPAPLPELSQENGS